MHFKGTVMYESVFVFHLDTYIYLHINNCVQRVHLRV